MKITSSSCVEVTYSPQPSSGDPEPDPVLIARVTATLLTDRKQLLELIYQGRSDQLSWRIDQPWARDREEYQKKWGKFDEGPLCPLLDKAWEEELESQSGAYIESDVWTDICGQWVGKEADWWTDQKMKDNQTTMTFDWHRSGHYIELKKLYDSPIDREDMEDEDFLELEDLRDLYVTVIRADQVFDSKSIDQDYSYQILWQRMQWEENLRDGE